MAPDNWIGLHGDQQESRAGPVVLAGGAAALGPQIAGAPVMYACGIYIYEDPNCDMLSAQ